MWITGSFSSLFNIYKEHVTYDDWAIVLHNCSTQCQTNPLLFRTKGTSNGTGVIIALFLLPLCNPKQISESLSVVVICGQWTVFPLNHRVTSKTKTTLFQDQEKNQVSTVLLMFAVTSQLKEMKNGRKIKYLLDYLRSDKLSSFKCYHKIQKSIPGVWKLHFITKQPFHEPSHVLQRLKISLLPLFWNAKSSLECCCKTSKTYPKISLWIF